MKRLIDINLFNTEPGEKKVFFCQLCGLKCNTLRGQYGPTSFLQAMAHVKSRHDVHICPNTEKVWHAETVGLMGVSVWTRTRKEKIELLEKLNSILSKNGCETFKDKL